MLDQEISKKILSYIFVKPRSVDEVAKHINKNWRTADRYIDKISKETGQISYTIFRSGTRGALKVVFWNNIEKVSVSSAQEKLFKEIERGRTKYDFAPFDIYQHISTDKAEAFIEFESKNKETQNERLLDTLRKSTQQILCFSGNMSWTNISYNNEKIIDILEILGQKGINIKVMTRVNLPAMDNIKKLLAINQRNGKDIIEIRHCEHPLRGFIVDDHTATLKEIKEPLAEDGFPDRAFVHYYIHDKEYVNWLTKVFWNLFSTSLPAKIRIDALNRIRLT